MKIEITKEQLKEMLIAAMFYSWIRGGLADSKGENFNKFEKLEEFLLKIARENNFSDLAEDFHGGLVPSDKLSELAEEVIEEYDDDVFWHELVMRLGKRDFWRSSTPDEKKKIEKEEWLPERVHELYEQYEKEFEAHGIDRLEVLKTLKDFGV